MRPSLLILFLLAAPLVTVNVTAGGINPERPNPKPPPTGRVPSLELERNKLVTQEYSKALFDGVRKFHEAHAALEIAVIDETRHQLGEAVPPNGQALADARASMLAAGESFQEAADKAAEAAARPYPAEWFGTFYPKQQIRLLAARDRIEDVQTALAAPTVDQALSARVLQDTLWHAASNSTVRTKSIDAENEIMWAVAAHLQIVASTNSTP